MVTWLLINKWKKMIKHESVLHVNQGIGKFFSGSNDIVNSGLPK